MDQLFRFSFQLGVGESWVSKKVKKIDFQKPDAIFPFGPVCRPLAAVAPP
jgi:hypothetical protein